MKLPYSNRRDRPPSKETNPPVETNLTRQIVLTNVQTLRHRIAKTQRNLRLSALFVGILLVALIVPASPLRQALGYGGGSGIVNPTCGQPSQIFAKLLKGEKYTLPSKAQLMQLPTPQQKPIALASDANYNPTTNQLCAGGWVALYTRFVHPAPAVQGSTNYDPNYGSNLVTSALSGLWTSFQQWLRDSLQAIIDTATTFGFMFVTPKGLTYGHKVVQNLQAWMLLFTNGAFALFMIIGGYKYMFGAYKGFREFAPTLIVAAIMANLSLPVLGQLIEVSNTVCTGILGVLATTGIGDLKLPLGLINWATAPEYLIIVYLIELVCVLLLCGQLLLRIAFLCVLLVTAPVGLFHPLDLSGNGSDFYGLYASPYAASLGYRELLPTRGELPISPGDVMAWDGGAHGHVSIVLGWIPPTNGRQGAITFAQANPHPSQWAGCDE